MSQWWYLTARLSPHPCPQFTSQPWARAACTVARSPVLQASRKRSSSATMAITGQAELPRKAAAVADSLPSPEPLRPGRYLAGQPVD